MSDPASPPANTKHPLLQVTDNDHGPVLVVIAYSFLFTALITVFARIFLLYKLRRPRGLDDYLIVLAAVIAIPQALLAHQAAKSGIGRHVSDLDLNQIQRANKLIYISQLLQIFILGTCKISVAWLITRLSPLNPVIRTCQVTGALSLVYVVFSSFAIAFQCDFPGPYIYSPSRCVGHGAMYYVVGALNILTDLPLSFIAIYMMWRVQLRLSARLEIIAAFLSRLVVVATIVGEIVTLTHFTNSDDPTWTNLIPSVLNQVMLGFAIITSCVPSLHNFLSQLNSGGFGLGPTENMELSRSGYGFGYGDASQGGSMFGNSRHGYGRGTNLKGSKPSKNSNNSSSSGNSNLNNGIPSKKGTFTPVGGNGSVGQDAAGHGLGGGYTQKRSDRTPFGSKYGHNQTPIRGEQRIYGAGGNRNRGYHDHDLERGLEGDDSSTKTLTRDAKGIHQTREIEVRVEDQYGNPAARRPSEGTVEREHAYEHGHVVGSGRPSTGDDSGESGEFYGVVR